MTSMDPGFGTANLIRNKAIDKRHGDPLPRLLAQLIFRAGKGSWIDRAVSRPWASALFEGRRHSITLGLRGQDAVARRQQFIVGIESAEWTLTGHFVADISIDALRHDGDGYWVDLSALTIEDW